MSGPTFDDDALGIEMMRRAAKVFGLVLVPEKEVAERDNLRTALHAARAELMLAEVGEKNPRDAVHWALIFLERGIK